MTDKSLPAEAEIVIVGGGIIGCSIAYHLTRMGKQDVVILEKSGVTHGATWHAAGLVGQLRSSRNTTRMLRHSVELYDTLEEETGQHLGWHKVGSLRLACSDERMLELKRALTMARSFGLEMNLVSADEAQKLFPLMSTDRVLGAAYLPTDGYIDPAQLTYALADGARRGGCRIFTETRVTAIEVRDGRVRAVEAERGGADGERRRIEAEVVVDAGGMYAAEIGRLAGVRVPVVPMSHQYLVTQPHEAVRGARERSQGASDGSRGHLPTLRDPDLLVYYREDGDGLVMGGYERRSEPAFLAEGADRVERIPPDFNGRLLEEEWGRFEEITENSKRRVPAMEEITVTKLINGPEAFTPDNEFCLGESEVAGFFVCAGFCAHGLAGAGGIGKVVAEWIAEGEPSLDLWRMDVRRFGPQYRSPAYTLARTVENYETYYDIHYPNEERFAGRPLRVTPVNAWHAEHDAAFGEKSGWERVNWYESNAGAGEESLRPRGWAGRNWSPAIGAEHRAAREAAAVFDESSFAKLEISGPGAAEYLEGLCDNRVARDVGQITYTQMLNRRGGIECDFTVARLGPERFGIVTGTAFGNHDREWMRRHLPPGGAIQLADVTSQWACFGLWGPRARDVLQPLTPQDLGNGSFPYMTLRETIVGHVPVRMLRVTYVGELGWELYCPTEYGAALWRALWEAGRPHGLLAGGYRAIDSLRLEKGYRVWGADVTPDETPYEGGLGFCVKLEKQGGFLGREALAAALESGPRTRLCCLALEDPRSIALGNEPVRVGGEIAGRVTTGGYGYTVQRSIAYAYLPPAAAEPGTAVEVEIFGRWVGGEVSSEPLFDPDGERIRA